MTGVQRRVVVFGASGQLGAALVRSCDSAVEIIAPSHGDVDLANRGRVLAFLADARPSAILNCAAYNAVDAAEDNPVAAIASNAIAVRTLARAAADTGATLVHFSSDFVFDGDANRPYTESDRPNPRSTYAVSKLLGEWFATDAPRHYVLRVESLFGGELTGGPARGSVASILETLLNGGEPRVFVDRTVSPTFVVDAARATWRLLESGAPAGVYHCVNTGFCTWSEFAEELARGLRVTPKLHRVKMGDVQLRAARPLYCALSTAKLSALGIVMPSWQDAVARYAMHFRHDVADQSANRQA